MAKLNLKGKKFTTITVVKEVGINKHRQSTWLCKCRCGKLVIMVGSNLMSGNTNSCGCYKIEQVSKRFRTHGLTNHKLYNTWKDMKKRCYTKKDKNYKNYGGRGITMCKEWLTSPQTFFNWAEKNGYKKGLCIDRNDNNGNYCPENCSWKTHAEQNRNHRRNVKYNGECAIDASRRLGGSNTLVANRIKLGWSLEKAFNMPLKSKLLELD